MSRTYLKEADCCIFLLYYLTIHIRSSRATIGIEYPPNTPSNIFFGVISLPLLLALPLSGTPRRLDLNFWQPLAAHEMFNDTSCA